MSNAENIKPSRAKVVAYMAANVVGVALVLGGISLLFWIARPYITLYTSSSAIKALEVKAGGPAGNERRIVIPSVLVDAPINEGFTEESIKNGIGHISESAVPGEDGTVILAGHNYAYFVQGDQNLFSLLHLIKPGAPIYIFWDGKKYGYEAGAKMTVPRDDPVIFADAKYPSLTLIASASSWDSATISATRRLLVRALPAKNGEQTK